MHERMRGFRLVIWASVVVLAAAVAGTTTPELARAQTQTPFESLRAGSATYMDEFYSRILHDSERSATWRTTAGTWTTGQQNVIERRWWSSARAARLMPKFGVGITRLTLAGTGAYIGWKLYQHYSGGADQEFDAWLDSSTLGADMLFNSAGVPYGSDKSNLGWARDLASRGCDSGTQDFNGGGDATCESGAVWTYNVGSALTNSECGGLGYSPCWVLHLNPVARIAGSYNGTNYRGDSGSGGQWWPASSIFLPVSSPWEEPSKSDGDYWFGTESQGGLDSSYKAQLNYMTMQTLAHVSEKVGKAVTFVPGPLPWYDRSTGADWPQRIRLGLTPDEMAELVSSGLVKSPGSTPSQVKTQNYTVPSPYTEPGDVGTETDTQNALDVFDSSCGRAFVNWVMEPGSYSFNPSECGVWTPDPSTFTLVAPRVNETYENYLDRLRTAGWLGTATTTELEADDALAEMGPNAVARVKVGTKTYVPGRWPSTAPRYNVNTSLSVWFNPDAIPEAPGAGQPLPNEPDGGLGTETPTGRVPGAGLPDSESLCDKFPFGVFCWVTGELNSILSVEARAPHFTANFPAMESGPFVIPAWTFAWDFEDTDVFDGFIALIRNTLAFLIWVGGLWWYGKSKLGARGLPDGTTEIDGA